MLYCLMFDHIRPSEEPLIPGIYNTKLIFGKDYDFRLQCDKDYITNFRQYEEEFRTHLTNYWKNSSSHRNLSSKPQSLKDVKHAITPSFAGSKLPLSFNCDLIHK